MEVEPLPGTTFGAVVRGVRLLDCGDAAWARVLDAFYEHVRPLALLLPPYMYPRWPQPLGP